MPMRDRFSVAITEYERARLLARRRQRRRLLERVDAGAVGGARSGLARDEVMAVGDNLNDVEMLEFAGTAVVMGNAPDDVKARGFRLTGTNDEDGLAPRSERSRSPEVVPPAFVCRHSNNFRLFSATLLHPRPAPLRAQTAYHRQSGTLTHNGA